MEGIDGVVHADQTSAQGSEYARARKLMLDEVNSAIDGALAGGATDIFVNDAHATHRNLQIEGLRPPARLASSSLKPNGMMEGLDSTFTAVIFVGYHARAGSQTGVLPHTGSGAVADLLVNGTRVGESGINTLYAASYGVPVVMITGDNVAVAQAQELTPDIDTVIVKDAIGSRAARWGSGTPESRGWHTW
jgi:D-amino peptidase